MEIILKFNRKLYTRFLLNIFEYTFYFILFLTKVIVKED